MSRKSELTRSVTPLRGHTNRWVGYGIKRIACDSQRSSISDAGREPDICVRRRNPFVIVQVHIPDFSRKMLII